MEMNPNQARVVDPILTNHARGYTQGGLIGDRLLPIVNMPTRAAKRIEFDRAAFRRYRIRRAPGGGIVQVDVGYEGKPVALSQYALAGKVPVEHLEEAAEVPDIDLQTESVNEVLAIIALEREIQQAEAARNAATYAAGNKVALAGAARWSDAASNPAKAVEDAKEVIRARTGRRPNKMAAGAKVAAALRYHPTVVDRFKHTDPSTISDAMLAQYFNLKEFLVGDAIYDDDQGASQDVWGTDAVLAFVPEDGQSGLRVPSFAYTYRLRGHPFVQPPYFDRGVRSWLNDVFDEWSPEIVGPDAGFLFQTAV